jgi:hypothetical protein
MRNYLGVIGLLFLGIACFPASTLAEEKTEILQGSSTYGLYYVGRCKNPFGCDRKGVPWGISPFGTVVPGGEIEKYDYEAKNPMPIEISFTTLNQPEGGVVARGHISWTRSDKDCLPGDIAFEAEKVTKGYVLISMEGLELANIETDGLKKSISFNKLITLKKDSDSKCTWEFNPTPLRAQTRASE